MSNADKPSLDAATQAALRCAKGLDEAHAAGYELRIAASNGAKPDKKAGKRLAKCAAELRAAGQEGRLQVEPWRLELAGASEGQVEIEGTPASSVHWGLVLAAEQAKGRKWTAAAIVSYFDGFPVDGEGRIDWSKVTRPPEDDMLGLAECWYSEHRLAEWEARLEREHAALIKSSRTPPRTFKLQPREIEERILKALRTSGKQGMSGDEIATAVGVTAGGGGVKGVLAEMRKRGQLLNRRGVGYWENPDYSPE